MPRIVDAHVHVFATRDQGLAFQRGNPNPERKGDLAELLRLMDEAGVDESVMLLYIPSWDMYKSRLKQVSEDEARSVVLQRIHDYNDWGVAAAGEHPGRLRAMVGVDPNIMDAAMLREEVASRVAAGASGVKIVLQAMETRANDRRLWPVYETCQDLDVPMLMQAGGRHWSEDPWGRPRYFSEVFESFPRLRIILAHLGAGFEDETVELTNRFPNCFTDVSSRLIPNAIQETLPPPRLVSLVRQIGVGQVLFGTNYPGGGPGPYLAALRDLPLTANEFDAIAGENAATVFRQ